MKLQKGNPFLQDSSLAGRIIDVLKNLDVGVHSHQILDFPVPDNLKGFCRMIRGYWQSVGQYFNVQPIGYIQERLKETSETMYVPSVLNSRMNMWNCNNVSRFYFTVL